MFCSNCGKKIEDDSKFCVNCGNSVESDTKQETPIKKDEPSLNKETIQKKPEGQSTGMRTFILIGIVILICGGLFYLISAMDKSESNNTKSPAEVNPISQPTAKAIAKDSRFIAYEDGTVLDTQMHLMWAAKDNGSNINWGNAKNYCENYSGGGYSGWRMPTQDELAGLYDEAKTQKNEAMPDYPIHLTELIDLTSGYPWASETRGSEAAYFFFGNGKPYWSPQSQREIFRALPVRAGKDFNPSNKESKTSSISNEEMGKVGPFKIVPFPNEFKKYDVHPWEIVKIQEFGNAYRRMLENSGTRAEWVKELAGVGGGNVMIGTNEGRFIVIDICKPHHCDKDKLLLLFNPSTGQIWGILGGKKEETWLGNPEPSIKNLLKSITKDLWATPDWLK